MKDIQSLPDNRGINISKVGIKDISYPVMLRDKEHGSRHTVASVNMFVNLPRQFKGTHMSRFIELLNLHHGRIDINSLDEVLDGMKKRLTAETAYIDLSFPFFISRTGKIRSYDCRLQSSSKDGLQLGITLPFCRRNLQGKIKILVIFNHFIWIEDLIALVEDAAAGSSLDDALSAADEISGLAAESLEREDALKTFQVITEINQAGHTVMAAVGNNLQAWI